jgi:prepilin-type N-terminal cleavage/methylation domain-containing protein
MHRKTKRRGFTLIELIIGMSVSVILLLAVGTVMVSVFGGFRQMAGFNQAIEAVDMIRQLNFDARTGDRLSHPVNNGDDGAYSDGTIEGQQVRFRAINYDPVTETDSVDWIAWASDRPTTADPGDPYTVRRWIAQTAFVPSDPLGQTPPSAGAFTQTFGQGGIDVFDVQRVSDNNFTVRMRTTFDGEAAAVDMSITLRNVN